MRTALRLAIWATILIACAGAGAFVAAHSNPFQPEVQGSTPSVSSTPSATPGPVVESWTMRITSNSWHQLVVGGRCRSRWRGTVLVAVTSAGRVQGGGPVRLLGRLRCLFPNAQIQAKTLLLSISGTRKQGRLAFELRDLSSEPAGAHDYGGFANTVLKVRLHLHLRDGSKTVHLRRKDATGRGRFESITVLRLACTLGCPGR
jgi:hypothetical protein